MIFYYYFIPQWLSKWCNVQVNPYLSKVLSSKGFFFLDGFSYRRACGGVRSQRVDLQDLLHAMTSCSWATFVPFLLQNPDRRFSLSDILSLCVRPRPRWSTDVPFLHVPAFRPRNTSLTDSRRCAFSLSVWSWVSPPVGWGGLGCGGGGGSNSPQIFSLVGFLFAWVFVARELLNQKSRQEKLFDKREGTLLERCGTGMNK